MTIFWVLFKSFFFIPQFDSEGHIFPLLGVGWTLNMEMFFYLILAIFMVYTRKWAAILTCVVLIGLKFLNAAIGSNSVFIQVYGHSYTTFFILGVLSYYLWIAISKIENINKSFILLPIAAIISVGFIILNATGEQSGYLVYFMPFSVVLMALLLHSTGAQCTWKPFLILGDISYALYLIHSVCLVILQLLANKWPILDFKHSFLGMIFALVICCLTATFFHYKIEKPITRMLLRKVVAGKTILVPQVEKVN